MSELNTLFDTEALIGILRKYGSIGKIVKEKAQDAKFFFDHSCSFHIFSSETSKTKFSTFQTLPVLRRINNFFFRSNTPPGYRPMSSGRKNKKHP
jgi:hypothetical protein